MTMNTSLQGKRLLVLGATMAIKDLVLEAKKMGVLPYVVDNREDSPAKKVAAKSFLLDCLDVDAIVDLAKREKVDGVITGQVDLLLPYCAEICKRLGMPFWVNDDNLGVCIDKMTFKSACEHAGVPTIPYLRVDSTNYPDVLKNIQLPVIIKPVDNSGSRGVYKCYQEKDLLLLCEKAFAFSPKKELIVEKLMKAENEISAFYMINHGKAYLVGMGDRFVDASREGLAPTGQGMMVPSKRLNAWETQMDAPIQRLFRENHMTDGFLFIQGFADGDNLYPIEIGYRPSAFSYKIYEHYQGYSQIQQLIRYSLTGSMEECVLEKTSASLPGCGFVLTIALLPGKIGAYRGIEEIRAMKGVVAFCQLHELGESVMTPGTLAQVFAYVLLATDTREELVRLIKEIESTIQITDPDGLNLVSPMIEAEKLLTY